MICFIIILSLLFEVVISNIVNIYSFLTPLFLITSLTILYPYFNGKKINFIIVCTIIGFIYDIVFTDSLFINTLSFGLVSLVIIFIYNYIKYSIYSSNIINILIIIFYRIISYTLLLIVDYFHFNIYTLFRGIYNSILINVIYGIIIFIIVDLIAKIFNIKKLKS